MEKAVFLFNGEIEINCSGIYTFAHYYYHPKINRKVIIVGMSHGGDKSYFQKIERALSNCDFVLFEDVSDSDEFKATDELIDLNQLFKENPDAAFLTAMRIYGRKSFKALNLTLEGEVFDCKRPNWILGDVQLDGQEGQEIEKKLISGMKSIPYQRKKEVVYYLIKAITKIAQNKFTRRDFGKEAVFIYSDPVITQVFIQILSESRDKHLFQKFDLLVQEKNPGIIGIKFGAGHTPFQRHLLEKRGYIRQTKKKLCNIKF